MIIGIESFLGTVIISKVMVIGLVKTLELAPGSDKDGVRVQSMLLSVSVELNGIPCHQLRRTTTGGQNRSGA